MKREISRRNFLATSTGAVASVTLLGTSMFDARATLAVPSHVRRDLGGMSPTDTILLSYAKAIRAMKTLPNTNPLSWCYQAAIHGTLLSDHMTAWNTCHHYDRFFWPWHRMYLYWFERIIRKIADDQNWALPYWDYASPSQRMLPAPFRDSTSPLYVANRGPHWNDGTASLSPEDVHYSLVLQSFNAVNALIQQGVHASVHKKVCGLMGNTATAAQDPIFFVHHSNIDRLWDMWLAQGSAYANPLHDGTWKIPKFTFFNEDGHPVEMSACDVLRAQQQLGYSYEGEPPQASESCLELGGPPWTFSEKVLAQWPITNVEWTDKMFSFQIVLTDKLKEQIALVLIHKNQTLFLQLDQVDADNPPCLVWSVFVGLPGNASVDPQGASFVGTFALFGSSHESASAKFIFLINSAIAAMGTNTGVVAVKLIPHGALINGNSSPPDVESPVPIRRASLIVETKKTNKQH
jgi:tyrosinase